MSTALVYNLPYANQWAAERIKGMKHFPDKTGSIGLMRDGRLVAVCVYSTCTENNITMSIASDGSKRWLTKQFLRACFEWPFNYLKARRVTALVRADLPEAIRFDEHIGFKWEGTIREGEEDGTDLHVYGMLREECRWID